MRTVTHPPGETPYLPLLPPGDQARAAAYERLLRRAAAAEGLPLP